MVYFTKNGLLSSDSRGDFRGGRTSLLLPPGAENPSYATARDEYKIEYMYSFIET